MKTGRAVLLAPASVPKKVARRFSYVVCVLALLEVAYLIHVNRTLASQYALIRAVQSEDPGVLVGQHVEQVVGFGRDGRRTCVVLRGGPRSLLFGISSQCPWCRSSADAFRRLAVRAAAAGYQVVFVSKDYLSDTLKSPWASALPGTIISEPTYRTYNTMKLSVVPTTAILSEDGIVEHVMIGQLDAAREQTIASSLTK